MNIEIGTVASQFLFWEHLFQIFSIGSLQCTLAPAVIHAEIIHAGLLIYLSFESLVESIPWSGEGDILGKL